MTALSVKFNLIIAQFKIRFKSSMISSQLRSNAACGLSPPFCGRAKAVPDSTLFALKSAAYFKRNGQ
jgi:hypothetical protein